MAKTIVGVFESHRDAEKAARLVKDEGLKTSDISIITKQNDDYNDDNAGQNFSMTNDNISDGVVTGGVLGGLAGLLIGAGTMIVPGIGIIAAAGPITGLISGAVTGGIVGGLIDLGIPENESREYENDIKEGKVVWSMRTDASYVDKIKSILKNCGAFDVEAY
ncbi:MAG: general stress protein [Ignavibacteriales bacterium]